MEKLDDDTVALLSRRAYDIAASTKGVKVFLNGKKIPIKSFKDYVDLFIKVGHRGTNLHDSCYPQGKDDDAGNQLKCVYEQAGPR